MNVKKYDRLTAAVFALVVFAPDWTEAKTIVVDAGGNCTLREAVILAHDSEEDPFDPEDYRGCVDRDGGPADTNTIILRTDVDLEDYGVSMIVNITIEGNGHTVRGVSSSSVFSVRFGKKLILNNLTVTGGSEGIKLNRSSEVILNNSIVSGNSGRGIYTERGGVTLNNSTVSGNGGTGVSGWRCGITLNNSTVSGNAAGVYVYEGSADLRGSLVSGNSGPDIVDRADSSWHTSFNVLGDSSKTNAQAFSGMFVPSSTDVTATSDGTRPTELAAILSPLADNSGRTQTHALPEGSPAIDLDANCSAGMIADQRGYSRPVGDGCDAGSFEFGGRRRASRAEEHQHGAGL